MFSNLPLAISKCFNTGLVSGLYAGGIIGLDFGYLMALSTVNILNCYNTGDITGNNAGGIFGGVGKGGTDALASTGGGGGATNMNAGIAGNGGSGIVIVRYAK